MQPLSHPDVLDPLLLLPGVRRYSASLPPPPPPPAASAAPRSCLPGVSSCSCSSSGSATPIVCWRSWRPAGGRCCSGTGLPSGPRSPRQTRSEPLRPNTTAGVSVTAWGGGPAAAPLPWQARSGSAPVRSSRTGLSVLQSFSKKKNSRKKKKKRHLGARGHAHVRRDWTERCRGALLIGQGECRCSRSGPGTRGPIGLLKVIDERRRT